MLFSIFPLDILEGTGDLLDISASLPHTFHRKTQIGPEVFHTTVHTESILCFVDYILPDFLQSIRSWRYIREKRSWSGIPGRRRCQDQKLKTFSEQREGVACLLDLKNNN